MSDEDTGKVLVFRNPVGDPIPIPEDIVEENDRTYRAYQLRLAGASWKAIAIKEGYLDAAAAQSDVSRYQAEARALITTHSRQEALQTEIARLDALQASLWGQAMKGHLPAIKTGMDLIITRIRIMGLDQPSKEEEAAGVRTVVIPISDEEYLSSLQRLGEPDNGASSG